MESEPTPPGDAYARVRAELVGALRSIDPATAATHVPACPAWTVREVAAHVCGLNAELLADIPGPLGSDEATSRQVADRSDASLGEVLDDWEEMAPAIGARFAAEPERATALLADLVVHAHDLKEVLDQPTAAADAATPVSAQRYIPLLQERVLAETNAALTVELDGGSNSPASPSDAAAALTVRTSSHLFLRGVTGRLRRSEVEAFDWSDDPTEILNRAWTQYGPFRD